VTDMSVSFIDARRRCLAAKDALSHGDVERSG